MKAILIDMLDKEEVSLEPNCISWFTIQVATYGVEQVLSAWNDHPIPG